MGSRRPNAARTEDVRIYLPEDHESEVGLRVPLFELANLRDVPGAITGFEVNARERPLEKAEKK